MDKRTVVLDIAIVDTDRGTAAALGSAFSSLDHVQSVRVFADLEAPLQHLSSGECNALLINIFSVGAKLGISFIEATRERVPHVPICLLGTTQQLTEMPDVSPRWQQRFAHYYKLPIDQPLVVVASTAGRIARLLSLYLLSGAARLRLREIRSLVGHADSQGRLGQRQERIDEALELVQEALDAKQHTADTLIVPGFDDQSLRTLVEGTLENASASLERSALVNKRVLLFGGGLVAAAFVVATVTGSWEAVTFGGMGLAGIITALIANPLKEIARTARRLIQIQVAYIGFLHVLGTAGSRGTGSAPESAEKRIESINEVIRTVLDALEKYCQ